MFETDAKSVVWGISPMFLIVGGLYHMISVAAPNWLANRSAHWGLWYFCPVDADCQGITDRLNDTDHSWYRVVQGLEICGTVFVLAAYITGLMRINLGHPIWQLACGICALLAGVFGLSGVLVYSKNYTTIENQELSWAFMFNAASSSMLLVAGPILIVDALLRRQ